MCFFVVGVDFDVGVWEGEFFECDPGALGEGAEPAGILCDVSGLGIRNSVGNIAVYGGRGSASDKLRTK